MKKLIISLLLSICIAVPVYADDNATPSPDAMVKTTPKVTKEKKTSKDSSTTKETSKDKKEKVKEKKDDFKDKITKAREKLKDAVQNKKDGLKKVLQKFKDTKKQDTVKKISGRLDTINDQSTQNFVSALDKLSAIFKKISARTDTLASKGVDTAALKDQVTKAQDALTTAQDAVVAQIAKVYTLKISDADSAKSDIQATRDKFFGDLTKTRNLVGIAKDQIKQAAVIIGQLSPNDSDDTNSSPSPLVSSSPSTTPTATPDNNN